MRLGPAAESSTATAGPCRCAAPHRRHNRRGSAEIEQHPIGDAVKDVRRVTGDQRGAGVDERVGGAAHAPHRLGDHVRPSVRRDEHRVAVWSWSCHGPRAVRQPAPQVGVRDPWSPESGGIGGGVVGERDNSHRSGPSAGSAARANRSHRRRRRRTRYRRFRGDAGCRAALGARSPARGCWRA